jgi:hypothetical protein
MNDPRLDKFAELVVERHDEIIDRIELAASHHSNVPKGYESLQAELAALDPRALDVLRKCVLATANDVMVATLFTVFEFADNGDWNVTVKGKELSDLTPGLHYELVSEDGWLRRFSKHPRPAAE